MSLSPFSDLAAIISDDRRQVRCGAETITFYTARSGERDLRQFREALQTVRAPHIPLLVAPYNESLAPLFADNIRFVWLAPLSFSDRLPDDARLIATEESLQQFINSVEADAHYEIVLVPQWQALQKSVREVTVKILQQAAVRLKTLRHFGALWPINFAANGPAARQWHDIQLLKTQGAPQAIVMAGPSLDQSIEELKFLKKIWVADTAFPVLTHHGIAAQVVFSADAGFASREHFVGTRQTNSTLVCDMLVNPGVARLPFTAVCTYASSHPLVQQFCQTVRPDLTEIVNPEGNVGSLMLAVFKRMFGDQSVAVFGYDRGHRRRITHARGTAYFRRSYGWQNRLANAETYMLKLSRRYS